MFPNSRALQFQDQFLTLKTGYAMFGRSFFTNEEDKGSAVENVLDLLESASALIDEADKRLKEAQGLTVDGDFEARAAKVVKKYTEVSRTIKEKELAILAILARIALCMSDRVTCGFSTPRNVMGGSTALWHTIHSSNTDLWVSVELRTENRNGTTSVEVVDDYRLTRFVDERHAEFFELCRSLLRKITSLLNDAPKEQEAAIANLRNLIHDIRTV